MKETGIIFTSESVRAILEGGKSQTRRVIKPQPASHWDNAKPILNDQQSVISWCFYNTQDPDFHGYKKCPYGQVGDRLWVRETWREPISKGSGYVDYLADHITKPPLIDWRPSIFMPRWASRITLEITEVRAERLQGIKQSDLWREGIANTESVDWEEAWRTITEFIKLWDSLNAKRGYSWEVNPWVWVISFATGVRLK